MTAKLHINLSQGVLDVEGDPELVREIYNDFKLQVLGGMKGLAQPQLQAQPAPDPQPQLLNMKDEVGTKSRAKRRLPSRKRQMSSADETAPTISPDAPKLDKSLDLASLPEYYEQFDTTNNAEKILVFLKYLNDELSIESPNTDQFYSCFERVNARLPKVFSQAFRDASGRRFGYINYDSPTSIKLTTVGNNHFKFDLKRKSAE